MTPFELDALVNPPVKLDSKKIDPNAMSEMKKKQQMMGDFYEENENDLGCRLYDKDFD